MSGNAKIPLYSDRQIMWGSFLGAPLSALYFLHQSLRQVAPAAVPKVMVIGGSLTFLMMVAIPYMPDSSPRMFIPLMYSLLAQQVAGVYHLNKTSIVASDAYTVESNWRVLGFSLGGLVIFMLLFLLVFLALDAAGLIPQEA